MRKHRDIRQHELWIEEQRALEREDKKRKTWTPDQATRLEKDWDAAPLDRVPRKTAYVLSTTTRLEEDGRVVHTSPVPNPKTYRVLRGELGTVALTPRQEGIARLMRERPEGELHGRRASDSASDDRRRRSTELGRDEEQDFLRGGGWTMVYLKTGQPNGRPPAKVTEELRSTIIRLIGFSPEEFRRLTRRGRPSAADAEARQVLAQRVAYVLQAGRGKGVEKALVDAYGVPVRTIYNLASRA